MSSLKDRMVEALAYRKTLAKTPWDITQAGLAKFCGVKAASVSNWFSGETKSLKGDTAIKAAKYLCVRPEWLTAGVGPMKLAKADGEASAEPDAAPRLPGGKPAMLRTLATFATIAKQHLEPAQLQQLAPMVGSMFQGAPIEPTVKAIDIVTPQLDAPAADYYVEHLLPGNMAEGPGNLVLVSADENAAWRDRVYRMALEWPAKDVQPYILDFLSRVDGVKLDEDQLRRLAEGGSAVSPQARESQGAR